MNIIKGINGNIMKTLNINKNMLLLYDAVEIIHLEIQAYFVLKLRHFDTNVYIFYCFIITH